jgi:glycosyltransferase involved in cell wall biosynthesis
VLTTCYNRAGYLQQAIESVLNSSFEDFEYIIVDDCSSDGSAELALGYAKTDPRVKVHVNSQNLGDYPNRARAAALAIGEYIKFVDSDDMIYPHGLAVMMDCMRRFPTAALGLSRPSDGARPYPYCLGPAEACRRHFFQDGVLSNAPLSAIIRRDCFELVGGFSGKRYVGDTELWLKLTRRHDLVLMPMGLTWWRSHGEQEFVAGHRGFGYLESEFELQREALTHPDCPLPEAQATAALRAARLQHATALLGIARRGHWRDFRRIAKDSGMGLADFSAAIVARLGLAQTDRAAVVAAANS